MSISVLNFKTKNTIETLPFPDFVDKYKDTSTHAISRVHYVSKKISFIKTASTKGISDVSGTTRKPYKQKGTGNARQGSLRSPQYRGGGIIFGPKPVTAGYKINKKERLHARKVLISKLLLSGCITIVDEISVSSFKTKDAKASVDNLGLQGYVAIIHDNEIAYESLKSFSNLKNIGVYSCDFFHIHEIVKYDNLVFTKKSFQKLTQVLS